MTKRKQTSSKELFMAGLTSRERRARIARVVGVLPGILVNAKQVPDNLFPELEQGIAGWLVDERSYRRPRKVNNPHTPKGYVTQYVTDSYALYIAGSHHVPGRADSGELMLAGTQAHDSQPPFTYALSNMIGDGMLALYDLQAAQSQADDDVLSAESTAYHNYNSRGIARMLMGFVQAHGREVEQAVRRSIS